MISGRNRQGQQGQPDVDVEQHARDQHEQQQLAEQVSVSVTTVAKFSVSEVTRLTILPEGNSS